MSRFDSTHMQNLYLISGYPLSLPAPLITAAEALCSALYSLSCLELSSAQLTLDVYKVNVDI